ncbi:MULTISPECIES: type II toxin-antitoxin system ParD family antitoxin [Spirulina sp. CCY15215]|uniref:ribbon-helix-helix domain-containing protein n=1 Tax=Spirulina sp. CCY15215 TaxID=2767591 RepID=UPI0019502917|nr:type II toxin-antitoxin system ParD family antitoxin [Spirulina major]
MQITLKPEHETFIQTQLAQGKYQSADDILSQALNLLQRQQDYEQWMSETRHKISEGVAALECGESIDGDIVIAQLRDRLHKTDAF